MKGTKRQGLIQQPAKHPGDVLFNQFMTPLGLTANRLALALHVSRQRISELISGRRGITAETALRLSRLFGTTAKFWLDMQTDYDLGQAQSIWTQAILQQIQPFAVKKSNSGMTIKQDKSRRKDRLQALPKLPKNEQRIYKLLSENPTDFDDLVERSGMDVGQLGAAITMLELSGLITRHFGDRYSKSSTEN